MSIRHQQIKYSLNDTDRCLPYTIGTTAALLMCVLHENIFQSIYLNLCMTLCLSICLSVYLFVDLYICLSIFVLSVCMPVPPLSVYLSVYMSVCQHYSDDIQMYNDLKINIISFLGKNSIRFCLRSVAYWTRTILLTSVGEHIHC